MCRKRAGQGGLSVLKAPRPVRVPEAFVRPQQVWIRLFEAFDFRARNEPGDLSWRHLELGANQPVAIGARRRADDPGFGR